MGQRRWERRQNGGEAAVALAMTMTADELRLDPSTGQRGRRGKRVGRFDE
jgi:hypothetical protein